VPEKYVVTTPKAIDEWDEGTGLHANIGFPECLDEGTFFVIRSSDVFGAPALYAYAHLIQTAVELDGQRRIFTDDERVRMEETAEYAVELAQEWQKRGDGRLPD
jgi:hypothetical protein